MAAVDLSTHPGHLARRLQQAHYLLWNVMVSEEITSPQFAVLNTLVAEPGLDQRTVGERVGLDRSTMSEVITRLGRRGLLDKVRDPQDGRRFLLRLTEDGVRTHRRLTVRTARMNQVFLAPLSEDEQSQFFELIRRVADAAEELRSPAEPIRQDPDRLGGAPAPDAARHGADPVTS
jgi:DNA-binding MarR family transcriptional regulator